MNRIFKWGFSFVFLFCLLTGSVKGQISTEQIFPETTQAYFAITDVQTLKNQWPKTSFGKILNMPGFDTFRQSLQAQVERDWTTRFGLKLRDVLALPSGEVGIGLIANPGQKPGYAMIMDIADKREMVNDFLTKIIKETTAAQNGEARRERLIIGNQTVEATVLVIPPSANYSETRTVYYVQLPSLLIITDQKYLSEIILQRLDGQIAHSILDLPTYQMIMKRCISDRSASDRPHIKFYANPLEAGEAIRALSELSETERNKVSTYSILAKQGFNGIKGVGGIYDMASENFDAVWRIMVYIPEAPTLSLRMLAFENVKGFGLPPWVGTDTATMSQLSINSMELFNNIGPVIDEALETEGAWNDIIVSLEKDENGPQVNLASDLIAHLDNQIIKTTNFDKPLTDKSANFFVAIPLKPSADNGTPNDSIVKNVLHRMFDTDPEFVKTPYKDDVIWTYAPKKKENKKSNSPLRTRINSEPGSPTDTKSDSFQAAFCVLSGYLFIASDSKYLCKTIESTLAGKVKSIQNSTMFHKVMGIIDKDTETTGRFIQGYLYYKDGYELLYNLYRQGKFSESQTFLARFIRALTPTRSMPESPLKIDASTLPPFESFQNLIGEGGYWGRVESNGWFIKGFTLGKE